MNQIEINEILLHFDFNDGCLKQNFLVEKLIFVFYQKSSCFQSQLISFMAVKLIIKQIYYFLKDYLLKLSLLMLLFHLGRLVRIVL